MQLSNEFSTRITDMRCEQLAGDRKRKTGFLVQENVRLTFGDEYTELLASNKSICLYSPLYCTFHRYRFKQ